jgi:hypothetical protein
MHVFHRPRFDSSIVALTNNLLRTGLIKGGIPFSLHGSSKSEAFYCKNTELSCDSNSDLGSSNICIYRESIPNIDYCNSIWYISDTYLLSPRKVME